MRRLAVAGAAVALVVGVLLVLLAHDVRAWHGTVRRGEATTASTALPSGLSSSLLGVGRDRDWVRALQRFQVAYDGTLRKQRLDAGDYRLLNRGQAALAKVTQDPSPAHASQAYNLLAVLVFREAYPGTVVVRRLVQESLTDLQAAVKLDPRNETAKENLELTLRVLVAVALAPQQARAAGTHRANAKRGGYEGPPGAGY
jgi:hypothetical protein